MPILWTLLGIAAFIFILLIIPLHVNIYSTPEFTVKVGYGFISIDVLKLIEKLQNKKDKKSEKKEKVKKSDTEKEKKAQNKEKENLKSFSEKLIQIKELLEAAKPAVIYLLNRTALDIYLNMKVSGEDACETAVQYGRMNALCACVYASVKNIFKVKKCRVFITPDFTAEESEISYDVKASLIPLHILGAAAVFIRDYIKIQSQKTYEDSQNTVNNNRKTVDKT